MSKEVASENQVQDSPKPDLVPDQEVKPENNEKPVDSQKDEPTDEIVFKGDTEEVEPEKKEEAQKPDEEAVVEKYDLKLPDGSKLGAKEVEEIESFAKEQKLSKESAQALLERENGFKVKYESELAETLKNKRIEWLEASRSDKTYGGERFSEFSEYATQAIEKFGGDDLKKIMNETGFGNHPVVFRTFAKIGKALQSDKIVRGKNIDQKSRSVAELFYPNQNK